MTTTCSAYNSWYKCNRGDRHYSTHWYGYRDRWNRWVILEWSKS